MKNKSTTYKLLKKIGIYLSPEKYGNIGLIKITILALRLWKNEILHKIARNSVIITPAPLCARLLRPLLHRLRGVNIGKNVFIGLEVMFDSVYPEKIFIGDGVIITNRVQLLAHNRDLSNYIPNTKIGDLGYIVKDIKIGNNAVIGIGSIILPGVNIGEGSVIGAGSIVKRDVPPYTLFAGVPAKKIKEF